MYLSKPKWSKYYHFFYYPLERYCQTRNTEGEKYVISKLISFFFTSEGLFEKKSIKQSTLFLRFNSIMMLRDQLI